MVLRNITTQTQTNKLTYEGVQFSLVKNLAQMNKTEIKQSVGLIIECDRGNEVRRILKELRGSYDSEVYLKPVFIKSVKICSSLLQQTDGRMDADNLYKTTQKAHRIQSKMEEIRGNSKGLDSKDALLLKATQYAFTREMPLKPYRNRHSKLGYSYPFLNSILDKKENLRLLDILEKSVKKDYFEHKVTDRVNLCQDCDGTYLNFRETCSNCGSLDLEAENLIHHFRCAYVGPESDFAKGNQLVCPKCDKDLRHIGIDYDKPSEINKCKSCNHQSQETTMKAGCVDCGHEMDLPFVQSRTIADLKLTEFGEKLAVNGFENTNSDNIGSSQPFGTIGWEFFKILLRQEQARVQLTGNYSVLGKVFLNESAFGFLDVSTKEVLRQEILNIVRNYLRPLDMLSSEDFTNYQFLMPETSEKATMEMQEIVRFNLTKLISHNLNVGDEILRVEIEKIN